MAVYLVRHGNALGRGEWAGDDAERPLTGRGRRQAAGLVDQLAGADVRRVRSSPAARCLSTVHPLALARGLELVADDALFEGFNGPAATDLARTLAAEDGDAVLCSHGDIIPEVLRRLARDGMDLADDLLCAKASTWRLHTDAGRITAATYLPPPA